MFLKEFPTLVRCIHVISFKGASGRFSFYFREVYEKRIENIRKFFIHMREINFFFCKKWYHSEEIYVSFQGAPCRSGRYHMNDIVFYEIMWKIV